MPPLPAMLLLLALAAGFTSYLHFRRYGDARARELDLTPEGARTGPTDDGGATTFDHRMWKEILSGEHRTENVEVQRIGRLAQRWTLASVVLSVLTIAVWASLQ